MKQKILIPIIISLLMIGIASAEIIYNEDFENGTANGWTLPSFDTINNVNAINGSYDLLIGQYAGGSPDIATYNFTEEQTEAMRTNNFTLSFKTRIPDDAIYTGYTSPTITIRDNLGTNMLGCSIFIYKNISEEQLFCINNGIFSLYANSTFTNHTYEVKYDVNDLAKTYDVYLDNSLMVTLSYTTSTEPIGDMMIGHLNNNNPEQEIDDITINAMNVVIPTCSSCNDTCSPCGGGCTATDLTSMFTGVTNFDTTIGDITEWNTSCITSTNRMFNSATDFNQDISGWDMSNVIDMDYMFVSAYAFNQNLNSWNTSNVISMQGVFADNNFNGDISGWDTSQVTRMNEMFYGNPAFNQPINSWNTSSVTDMNTMFRGDTSFNQDISSWDVSQVNDMSNMFQSDTLTTSTYDAILNGWANQSVQSNVPFNAGNSQYTIAGLSARNTTLIGIYTWTISDGGMQINCTPNWTCDTFGSCNSSNIMPCTSMADLNICGNPFTGNIADYDTSCIYIPPSNHSTTNNNDFTGAVMDNGVKLINGFGRIAIIFGIAIAGILIVVGVRKLILKK